MAAVVAELHVQETTRLHAMLVTVYHKTFVYAHTHVISRLARLAHAFRHMRHETHMGRSHDIHMPTYDVVWYRLAPSCVHTDPVIRRRFFKYSAKFEATTINRPFYKPVYKFTSAKSP